MTNLKMNAANAVLPIRGIRLIRAIREKNGQSTGSNPTWELLLKTYSDASYASTWETLFATCTLDAKEIY